MLEIQRLNHDSSWMIYLKETTILLDPWLIGSEIDGFSWLNEQWHVVPPIPVEELPPYDLIVISQSYEDHCHLNTLELLKPSIPILATSKAYRRLKKRFPDRDIRLIPESKEGIAIGGVRFIAFRPNKKLDPIYFSLLISTETDAAIFYAPHGFKLSDAQLEILRAYEFHLLMSTCTDFRLPAVLGGHVNPGVENVAYLCGLLNPRYLLNTHDEEKIAKGLVARYAKITYPDYESLERREDLPFLSIMDYKKISFSENGN